MDTIPKTAQLFFPGDRIILILMGGHVVLVDVNMSPKSLGIFV